jgi:hypothetical protein
MLFTAEINDAMWNDRLKCELDHATWESFKSGAATDHASKHINKEDAECGEE